MLRPLLPRPRQKFFEGKEVSMPSIRDSRRLAHRIASVPVALVLVAGLGLGAAAQNDDSATQNEQQQDRVVARIDGDPIYMSELQAVYQALRDRLNARSFESVYPQLLEHAITMHLIARAARQRGLDESEQHRRRMRIVENRLLRDAYIQDVVYNQIDEEALQAAYEDYREDFEGEVELRISHILVETRSEAERIIERLQGGADFAQQAREHSTDPSKEQGGDLGFFTREQMHDAFAEAAFEIEVGSIGAEPIQTPFGWHVIKVTDRRRQEPPELEEVRDELRVRLARQIAREQLERLQAVSRIERFAPDGSEMEAPSAVVPAPVNEE